MRSMREAADAFLRAERDQTAHVVTAHRKVAEELATAEAERWRLQGALTDANALIRSACAEAAQASAERDEAVQARRMSSADLGDMASQLKAAQVQGANAEKELHNLRSQLTLTSNQLAGVQMQLQMQLQAERAHRANDEGEQVAMRERMSREGARADAAATAALQMQARVGELERKIVDLEQEIAQLQLLRATLISKFELKDEQLGQMQATHRETRAELLEARRQLREMEPDDLTKSEHVAGAHDRIKVFREAQKELRTVRQQAKLAHSEFGPAKLAVRQGV